MPNAPKLDFSEFHDLMHPAFSLHCFSLPGGPIRHVRLSWEYRVGPEIEEFLWRHTFCRIDRHLWQNWYRAPEGGWPNDMGFEQTKEFGIKFTICRACGSRAYGFPHKGVDKG